MPCGKKRHYANKLENCQSHERTQLPEVTAVNTHNYEEGQEDKHGENLDFEFCSCHLDDIDRKLGEDGKIPESWILLDNQSTINIFNNKSILMNIQKVST